MPPPTYTMLPSSIDNKYLNNLFSLGMDSMESFIQFYQHFTNTFSAKFPCTKKAKNWTLKYRTFGIAFDFIAAHNMLVKLTPRRTLQIFDYSLDHSLLHMLHLTMLDGLKKLLRFINKMNIILGFRMVQLFCLKVEFCNRFKS